MTILTRRLGPQPDEKALAAARHDIATETAVILDAPIMPKGPGVPPERPNADEQSKLIRKSLESRTLSLVELKSRAILDLLPKDDAFWTRLTGSLFSEEQARANRAEDLERVVTSLPPVLRGHEGGITAMSLARGNRLVSVGRDGNFYCWDLNRSDKPPRVLKHVPEARFTPIRAFRNDRGNNLAVNIDERFASQSRSFEIWVWDLDNATAPPRSLSTGSAT